MQKLSPTPVALCPLLLPRSYDLMPCSFRTVSLPCTRCCSLDRTNHMVYSFYPQLASQVKITPPETGYGGNRKLGYPTCFAPCPAARTTDPATNKRAQAPKTSSTSVTERASVSSRTSVASTTKTTIISHDARVIVGYSDGSLASISLPPPHLPPPLDFDGLQREGGGVVRRLRRVNEGAGTAGEGGADAGVTALCSVLAPFGLLVVAGDSGGRLGLWTTSALQSGR